VKPAVPIAAACLDAGRQTHEGRAGDSGALGQSAMVALADAGTVQDDAVARVPAWVVARFDRADEVDSGNQRPDSGDTGASSDGEPVLEVDARIVDDNGGVARHEKRLIDHS
jgi:hypothetical protein